MKKRTPLQIALADDRITDMTGHLAEDIKELFTKYSGDERVRAVAERVQRYAVEKLGLPVDTDYSRIDAETLNAIRQTSQEMLEMWVPAFISDKHREFIVRCHARGLSTSDAIWELVKEDSTIASLAQEDAVGFRALKTVMVMRLAYLKPGSTRWPEKKYGAIWQEERERYKKALDDVPLSSLNEQTALLAKHANHISTLLNEDVERTPADWHLLTNSLIKTIESLRKISRTEKPVPVKLSAPELTGTLESALLALSTTEHRALDGETSELVAVLERLTLALKSTEQKAITDAGATPNNENPESE